MPRRNNDPPPVEMLFELLQVTPWFVGPILSGITYVMLAWVAPWWWPMVKEGDTLQNKSPAVFMTAPLGIIAKSSAPFFAGLVLLVWGTAEVTKFVNRRRLDQVESAEDIRDLTWRDFEKLLCEAFRRQGYVVEHSGQASADGGVDIRLMRSGQKSLVQCKHWKSWQVGVKVVRELLGVVTSERAQWGILVTSGTFTNDAIEFANKNGIQLIDGRELGLLIESVRAGGRTEELREAAKIPSPESCPKCGSAMVVRTAKRGNRAGSDFYGCTRYPRCNGIRQV